MSTTIRKREKSSTESSSSRPRGRRRWIQHHLANRWIYRWTALGCAYLPRVVLRGLSIFVNTVALILMRRTVEATSHNYRIALGLSMQESIRLVRQLFYSYGLMTIDLFRMRVRGFKDLPDLDSHDHDDRIVTQCLEKTGRGAVLVTGHLGNWELGGVYLAKHGVPVTLVGQPELDEEVQALRDETRSRFGIGFIEIGSAFSTALRIRKAIDAGQVVAMVADRSYPEDHIEVDFFGQKIPFLRSPAQLARFCQCPLIPCTLLRDPSGSYRSYFETPLWNTPGLPALEADRELMNATAKVLEKAIRQKPDQWYNFFNYWQANRQSLTSDEKH